ncbi:MAG: TIGR03016 family PEP-CTERM system-associated outer membrane protein, partial [Methylococcales bacterium]
FSQNISLNSGHDFSLFNWSFSFNNSDRNNSGSENVSFQNSQLEVRYAIGRKYSIFARGGYSNNSFATNSNSSNNGISYTFGGQWEPSQRLRVQAGYGNNKFITIEISPFNRLHWITTYSNNDIGLNTGNTWNTELNYNTRRSEWTIRYSEDTTTTQQLLLNQQVVSTSNNTSPLFSRNTTLPTLTNEVFVSKTADISFSFQTGKSNISANAYKTLRTFELSGNDEKVTGLSTSWNWKFLRRTNSNLRLGWQKTQSDGLNNFSDKRFNFSASVTRNILARLNGSIEYRFVDQSSSDNSNQYSENRITATLSLQY